MEERKLKIRVYYDYVEITDYSDEDMKRMEKLLDTMQGVERNGLAYTRVTDEHENLYTFIYHVTGIFSDEYLLLW